MTLDTATQAKQLLDLIATPSALVGGTLLAFAGRAIKDNITKVDKTKMAFGSLAAIAAVGLSASLAALMSPIAFRALASRGNLSATLVVFWMIFLSVCGTFAYAIWTLAKCVEQLRRPSK